MTVYTGDIETTARTELGNATATQYPAAVLDRAINEVNSDFSRVMPEELVYETTYRVDVTNESWTSAAAHGTYVALANALIKYESEKVKNAAGTTTYTRDTDYTMDYVNGKITTISGGAMAVATAYLITYERSGIAIKISSIADLITPIRVETPLTVPQEEPSFWRWGNYLFIRTSEGNRSQDRVPDKAHIRVYYYGTWTAPTATARGSFPAWLDDIMVKGVVAYSLGIKSRERGLQSIAYLQDASGSLRSMAGVYAKLDAALAALSVAATGPYAGISTALAALSATNGPYDKISAALALLGVPHSEITAALATLSSPINKISTALDALSTATTGQYARTSTALSAISYSGITTALAELTAAASGIYAKILATLGELAEPHSDIGSAIAALKTATTGPYARLDTALATLLTGPLSSISTVLGAVPYASVVDALTSLTEPLTKMTSVLSEIEALQDAIHTVNTSGDLFDAAAVWGDELAAFEADLASHIATGAPLIQAINIGGDAAEMRRRYAELFINKAQLWSDKRKDILRRAEIHIAQIIQRVAEASAWSRKAENYLAEAQVRVQHNQTYLTEAGLWVQKGQLYLAESSQWAQKGQLYIAEMQQEVQEGQLYIAESQELVSKGQLHLSEAQTRTQLGQLYVAEAQQWIQEGQLSVAEARGWAEQAQLYISATQQWVQKGQLYVAESQEWARKAEVYLGEAAAWTRKAETYIAEANIWLQEAQVYQAECQRFVELSVQESQVAVQLKTDSLERHTDYWRILTDRVQMARPHGQVSTKQYAAPFSSTYGTYPKGG